MALSYNFVIEEGATLRKEIQVLWGGRPFDLTGYEVFMQARVRPDDPPVLDLSTVGGGIEIVDAHAGRMVLKMSAEDTSALEFVSARYTLELHGEGGYVIRLLEGFVTLSKEFTK